MKQVFALFLLLISKYAYPETVINCEVITDFSKSPLKLNLSSDEEGNILPLIISNDGEHEEIITFSVTRNLDTKRCGSGISYFIVELKTSKSVFDVSSISDLVACDQFRIENYIGTMRSQMTCKEI